MSIGPRQYDVEFKKNAVKLSSASSKLFNRDSLRPAFAGMMHRWRQKYNREWVIRHVTRHSKRKTGLCVLENAELKMEQNM